MKEIKKRLLIILGIMLALVPLGLLTDNPAWGEWDLDYYKQKLGFVPQGIEKAASLSPLIPDYEVPGLGAVSGYYLSAIIGVVLVFVLYFILVKILKAKNES
ncbi:MAG: PDGLE domain-containing protein [Nautiliaceae bacterium]